MTLAEATRQLLTAYQGGAAVALLFDYDGTLTPIVPHPWLAEMSAETRELLQQLIQQPRLHLAILSGRSLEELIQMVGLANLYYCGHEWSGAGPARQAAFATSCGRSDPLHRRAGSIFAGSGGRRQRRLGREETSGTDGSLSGCRRRANSRLSRKGQPRS